MNDLYGSDNFFWRWFAKIADIVVLGLLWLLCCLPVLTIAPACIALYDTVARCIHGTDEHPYKHFFRVFKAELLRGIGISALWGVVGFALVMGYNLLVNMGDGNTFVTVYSMVYLVSMVIPVGIFAWLIPLEARFTNTFFGLHKTAATFAIVHLPTTAIMLGIVVVAAVVVAFVPVLFLVLPGIVVTLQCWFVEKVFRKYIEEDQEGTKDDTTV